MVCTDISCILYTYVLYVHPRQIPGRWADPDASYVHVLLLLFYVWIPILCCMYIHTMCYVLCTTSMYYVEVEGRSRSMKKSTVDDCV